MKFGVFGVSVLQLFGMNLQEVQLIFGCLLCAVPRGLDSWHVLQKRVDSQL
jgi:hypothetical protein